MAFTPFSAKNAAVRVNAFALVCKKWSVEMDADELECSNFEGGGYSDTITGLKRARITIELDIDQQGATYNPWTGTALLVPGNDNALKLYVGTTAGPYWDFPVARCLKNSNPSDVKQLAQGTWTFTNRGTFTPPTGAIS